MIPLIPLVNFFETLKFHPASWGGFTLDANFYAGSWMNRIPILFIAAGEDVEIFLVFVKICCVFSVWISITTSINWQIGTMFLNILALRSLLRLEQQWIVNLALFADSVRKTMRSVNPTLNHYLHISGSRNTLFPISYLIEYLFVSWLSPTFEKLVFFIFLVFVKKSMFEFRF